MDTAEPAFEEPIPAVQGDGAEESAVTDKSEEASVPTIEELTFDQAYDILGRCVTRHPLNRDVLYDALVYCAEERILRDAENHLAALPAFATATQNQYFLLMSLVKAYGLDYIERDEAGELVTADRKEGLTEDEIDDLVATVSFKTTEVGLSFVEQNKPQARLVSLLQLNPERVDTYREVLEFVDGQPRSYNDIKELLAGRPVLQTFIDGKLETMQPSVFVDKLERAGALVWNNGWTLTREGKEFLIDLQNK